MRTVSFIQSGCRKRLVTMIYRWADPKFTHLTDALLTKIEDSLRYRKVFGFSVGDVTVSAGDLNTIKVCRLLVPEIFKDSSQPPEKLPLSIKARVSSYVQ